MMVAAWLTGGVVAPITAVLSASGVGRGRAVGGEATRSTRRSQGTPASEEALVSALRPELERARWYQGKSGRLASLRLVDRFDVPGAGGALLAIVKTEDVGGSTAEYAMAARLAPDG